MSETSGNSRTQSDEHQPGDTLRDGRYAIAGKLGEGGQATTFEAVDKREGRHVAIKRFRVRGASSWKEVELAEREAKVLAQVRHPNLPVYIDHFEEQGSLYLVTEHIAGETLASLRAAGPLDARVVARFLADAADALDYLHHRAPPLVHRDIKPSNVIRRRDGSFAIIDFGAVRDRLKITGSTVVGTFGYMAPEQFQGRAMPASDVYSVGATALTMLTGREPEELPHKGLGIDVEAALGGSASPAMVRALKAMLEPNPDLRAGSVAPLLAGELRAMAAKSHEQPRGEKPRGEKPRGEQPRGERRFWTVTDDDSASAGEAAQRAVTEAEVQVKRVVEELGEQVRRAVAEASYSRGPGSKREAKRAAEALKREAKRAIKDAKRGVKAATERGKRSAPVSLLVPDAAPRDTHLSGPLLLIVLIALTIAQIAVLVGLKVVAPVVLYVVSAMFLGSVPGKAMRRAAGSVSDAGTRAATAIGRAKDVVRGREPADPSGVTEIRATVDPHAATEVRTVEERDSGGVRVRVTDTATTGSARAEEEEARAEEEAAQEEKASGQRRRGRVNR